MRRLCFTVDLDRDANIHLKGHGSASSNDIGHGTKPRFSSSAKGTEMLTELFDEMGVKTTFFCEARTLHEIGGNSIHGHEAALHGLDHEDMVGKTSGNPLNEDEITNILTDAIDIISDETGTGPKGFRAPYMRFDGSMYPLLKGLGIEYDSSEYAETTSVMMPFEICDGLMEIPVPKGYDRSGNRIYGYLWQMHESRRASDDYIELARSLDEGTFVLATHSWHITESCDNGMFSERKVNDNINGIRKIITTLMDDGFRMCTMHDVIASVR